MHISIEIAGNQCVPIGILSLRIVDTLVDTRTEILWQNSGHEY